MAIRKRGYYSNSTDSEIYNYDDVKDLWKRCLHFTPHSINVDRIIDAPSVAEITVKLMGEVVPLLEELHELIQLYEIGETLHQGEVRKLDVLLNGPEGAAPNPRLIDVVKQVESETWKLVRVVDNMTNAREVDVKNGKIEGCVVILLGPDGNYRSIGYDFSEFNPLHDDDLYKIQRDRAKVMLWRNFVNEWVDAEELASIFVQGQGIRPELYYLDKLVEEGCKILDKRVILGE